MSLTEQGREKIVKAQKKRWADYRRQQPTYPCGHPRTPENTRTVHRERDLEGAQCRTCEIERSRAYRRANREELNARRRARAADPERKAAKAARNAAYRKAKKQ